MYTYVAVLGFLAVLVAHSSSKPCESPHKWEADESIEIDAKEFIVVMKVSYDGSNKRIRALVQYDPEGNEYIFLYKKHLVYHVVHKTGKCTVSAYDKPFMPAQVPANATFVGEAYLGLKNAGLPYDAYYGTMEVDGSKGTYLTGVTKDGCIPFFSKSTVKGVITRVGLYNVELGIKDPSVFTPPKSCKEGPLPDILKNHPRY